MQFLQIHRLNEVLDEPGLFALYDILGHSVGAQCDGWQLRLALAKFVQQFQSGPVGQADIGDEEVELFALAQFDGALRIVRRANPVASRFQETMQAAAGIGVIFNQQDVHRRYRTSLGFRSGFPRKHLCGFEPQPECRAIVSPFTFSFERGAMRFGQTLRDRESQTQTAEAPADRSITLLKGGENSGKRF